MPILTTTVWVTGMQTEHCRRAVFTALSGLTTVRSAEVRLGEVTIEHEGGVTVALLREAIAVAGYGVTEGMTRRSLPTLFTFDPGAGGAGAGARADGSDARA